MDDVIIKAEGLTKRYNAKAVVNYVSMSVRRGQIYGFIGANGAGKTTFLRMIMGLVRPDSGSVELFGDRTRRGVIKNRAKIGCIIETPALIPTMTAQDCMTAQKLLLGKKDADIEGLLSTVGLRDTGAKKVKDFSLGMKQRLAIAQALINRPEALILDEPTNGMDPEGIVEIRNLLKGLAADGMTILMSSHILSELEQLATHFGIIDNGMLIDDFSPGELNDKQIRSVTIWVDSIVKAKMLLAGKIAYAAASFFDNGIIRITDGKDFKTINKILVKDGVTVDIVAKESGDLEKYFMGRIGQRQGL